MPVALLLLLLVLRTHFTDNRGYNSFALVTGGLDGLPVAARIDVDGH